MLGKRENKKVKYLIKVKKERSGTMEKKMQENDND